VIGRHLRQPRRLRRLGRLLVADRGAERTGR
jgi:hypothetical protein